MRKNSRFEVFSHRGLGFGFTENSLQAMAMALSSDVAGVEIDIRLTKDKKWVVMHNPHYRSEKKTVLWVHEHRYDSLKKEAVLLETMLAIFASFGKDKTLMIDVKDVGCTKKLVGMIRDYRLQKKVIVVCWEPEVIRRIRKSDKTIRIGLSYVPIHSTMKFLKGAIDRPLTNHSVIMRFNEDRYFEKKLSRGVVHQHYLAYIPDLPLYSIQVPAALCSKKLVDLAHARMIKVIPFVVDTKISAAIIKRRGVDGILSNKPLSLKL